MNNSQMTKDERPFGIWESGITNSLVIRPSILDISPLTAHDSPTLVMRRQRRAFQPGGVPKVHRELSGDAAAVHDEGPALRRRLIEAAGGIQLVAARNVGVGLLQRLNDVAPYVVNFPWRETAADLFGRE